MVVHHAHAAMDRQIAVAQNIGAAQAKEQQHFGGPNTNAFERRKRRNGFGVVHLTHRIQIELPRSDFFGTTLHVPRLRKRDAARLQLFFGGSAHGDRRHLAQALPHAIPYGRLSCSRDLLADNLMHDR